MNKQVIYSCIIGLEVYENIEWIVQCKGTLSLNLLLLRILSLSFMFDIVVGARPPIYVYIDLLSDTWQENGAESCTMLQDLYNEKSYLLSFY